MWKDYRKGGLVGAGVMPEAAKPLLPGERIVDAFVADIMRGGTMARVETMSKSALDVISKEQLAALREAGFVVVHREPTEAMLNSGISAAVRVYGSLEQAYHRMVGESIREQNKGGE